jgi:hypothetical protein
MSLTKLVFEKVGDINTTYPYLCVYDEHDRLNPFMDIGISDDKKLQFSIYVNTRNIVLSIVDWSLIREKALEFLPKVLADEANIEEIK